MKSLFNKNAIGTARPYADQFMKPSGRGRKNLNLTVPASSRSYSNWVSFHRRGSSRERARHVESGSVFRTMFILNFEFRMAPRSITFFTKRKFVQQSEDLLDWKVAFLKWPKTCPYKG
jgi:hypothetical protein